MSVLPLLTKAEGIEYLLQRPGQLNPGDKHLGNIEHGGPEIL